MADITPKDQVGKKAVKGKKEWEAQGWDMSGFSKRSPDLETWAITNKMAYGSKAEKDAVVKAYHAKPSSTPKKSAKVKGPELSPAIEKLVKAYTDRLLEAEGKFQATQQEALETYLRNVKHA